MKCKKKARGLTIIGVMVGVVFTGSAIPTSIHLYAQRRAEDRLDSIESNLAGIDVAVAQWNKEHRGGGLSISSLDGTDGTIARAKWSAGPVSGTYSISPEDYRAWMSAVHRNVPACATFDGGNKGPMNRPEWQIVCGPDPTSCGL